MDTNILTQKEEFGAEPISFNIYIFLKFILVAKAIHFKNLMGA